MSLYNFSFVGFVSLLYLFSALVFLSYLCIVNRHLNLSIDTLLMYYYVVPRPTLLISLLIKLVF